MVSDGSDFAANIEVCPANDGGVNAPKAETPKRMEEFATPKLRTIEDLSKATGVPAHQRPGDGQLWAELMVDFHVRLPISEVLAALREHER